MLMFRDSALYISRFSIFLMTSALVACAGSSRGLVPMSGASQGLMVGAIAQPDDFAPKARYRDLVYASGSPELDAFKFPGARINGSIPGGDLAQGMCADHNNNVYITYGFVVNEYPHASTKVIATWNAGNYEALACAVDPTTSTLAVVNSYTTSNGPGNIAIYPAGQSTPIYYTASNITYPTFAGYDNKGNLFVDGTNKGAFALAELPTGGKTFVPVTIKRAIGVPAAVEWDGSHLAVGDGSKGASIIYRLTVKNFKATVSGTVLLAGPGGMLQFDVFKKQVVVASVYSTVSYYNYPQGGAARKTIQITFPYGVVVSAADKPAQ